MIRDRRKYQLVYFLMQGFQLVTGLPASALLSRPAVMKISGSNLIPFLKDSWVGRLELRFLKRYAKRIMILNAGMVVEAVEAGFNKDLLLWMPNPVDIAQFAPLDVPERAALRQKVSLAADTPMVIFVGRLAPEKQLHSLLDAFVSVVRRLPQAVLVLAGDGPDREALEARCRGNMLHANVRFLGRLSETQVRDWLCVADVFALVSSQEGFPVSLIEAMATGLPSVVSDIPANTQLIDSGVHGAVVPVGDAARIADSLIQLLADPQMRSRMSLQARSRVVENYSTEKVIDRYETLFAEVLSK
jgi:glycosyltransferase involved in cell wall biosynthesis